MTLHTLAAARTLRRWFDLEIKIRFAGGSVAQMRMLFGTEWHYAEQGPGNLGERLGRAFDDAFKAGCKQVVAIGTDCPQLTPDLIRSAFYALREKDLVLGPARDGGYYLIGLRAPHLVFDAIPWGTDRVLAQTLKRAHELRLDVQQMIDLDDVDRPQDLPVWERVRANLD